MYYFTYLTTNLANDKKYIGDHSTNNINDSYLGSGVYILKAIKKYIKSNKIKSKSILVRTAVLDMVNYTE